MESSDHFGFVRQAELISQGLEPIGIDILDGIQNLLPWGIEVDLQLDSSNLASAYKKNELDLETGLAIFSLSALIVDD